MCSLTVKRTLCLMIMTLSIVHTSSAFSASLACGKESRGVSWTRVHAHTGSEDGITVSRRDWFGSLAAAGAVICAPYQAAFAEEQTAAVSVPMKEFVDPLGYFSIRVPKAYFALRRTAKGDLPDEKTGLGRRGSSIFTAGDMGKAELIAVERFPTRVLLEENGIQATGSLSTIPDLGTPSAVANLIILRREKDKPGTKSTALVPNSVYVSPDGKDLFFKLKTDIDVQKPELLMEQTGVSTLARITSAKASLRSNDGKMMAVFASALEQDFNGPDGVALQEAVTTFTAIDQSAIINASS